MLMNRGKRLRYALASLRARSALKGVLETVDLQGFRTYQKRYQDADPPPLGYSKYLNIREWLLDKLTYFHLLGLHKVRGLRILDLGTGAGYFPYICAFYGHRAVALDLDIIPMYNELCQFLRVDRRTYKIVRFEKLPDFGTRFDLVTGFMIKFNQHDLPDQWGVNEWSFILDDLVGNQLAPSGRIFLALNTCRDGTWYDDALKRLFLQRGCTVRGNQVLLDMGSGERRQFKRRE